MTDRFGVNVRIRWCSCNNKQFPSRVRVEVLGWKVQISSNLDRDFTELHAQ